MGWSSGSSAACNLTRAIKKHVKDREVKKDLYYAMVDALVSCDWDRLDEAEGIDPVLDKVLKSYYPDDDDED